MANPPFDPYLRTECDPVINNDLSRHGYAGFITDLKILSTTINSVLNNQLGSAQKVSAFLTNFQLEENRTNIHFQVAVSNEIDPNGQKASAILTAARKPTNGPKNEIGGKLYLYSVEGQAGGHRASIPDGFDLSKGQILADGPTYAITHYGPNNYKGRSCELFDIVWQCNTSGCSINVCYGGDGKDAIELVSASTG
jgi:hypothetical protein